MKVIYIYLWSYFEGGGCGNEGWPPFGGSTQKCDVPLEFTLRFTNDRRNRALAGGEVRNLLHPDIKRPGTWIPIQLIV